MVLEIEPRLSGVLDKCSATELSSQPILVLLSLCVPAKFVLFKPISMNAHP